MYVCFDGMMDFKFEFVSSFCEWKRTILVYDQFINSNQFVNVRTDFMLIRSWAHPNCVSMNRFYSNLWELSFFDCIFIDFSQIVDLMGKVI